MGILVVLVSNGFIFVFNPALEILRVLVVLSYLFRGYFNFFFKPANFGCQQSRRDSAHEKEGGFYSLIKTVLADKQAYTQRGGGNNHHCRDKDKNCFYANRHSIHLLFFD